MLNLIVAPYHLGKRNTAVGAGPLRVLETPIAERTSAAVTEIDAGLDCDWREVNHLIGLRVRETRKQKAFPLILAGNCNSCLGTLSGIEDLQPGIIWFDAHGDFHTPETSNTGSLEGMSLTMATRKYVPERKVILVGGRDLDPGEDRRVAERILHVPDGDLSRVTMPLKFESAYVHIDLDVLDPTVSPGVNFRGPGGLSLEQLIQALAFTFERFHVAALAIVNYNPARDSNWRTRDIVLRLIEAVGALRENVRNG